MKRSPSYLVSSCLRGYFCRATIRLAAALVALAMAPAVASAEAADIVYLQSAGGRGEARLVGEVIDEAGGEIRLRLADGREVQYPSSRVARIETDRTPAQTAAEQALATGDLRQALVHFKRAVADEPRQWMRRRLLAEMVWCYRGLDDLSLAARTFLLLLESDPQTSQFDAIPLLWDVREPDPQLTALARSWLQEKKSPAAELLGASYLLAASDRAQAAERLRQLERSPDARIAGLAHAQLWRLQIVAPREGETDRWQAAIERLPESLRGGPYFVLGQALARQSDRSREAALAFLRAPILYGRDRGLSASALLAAGEALEQCGDVAEARRLYHELVDGYGGSIAARDGKARLDALGPAPAG